ncbi:MAG: hypothetical protein ABFR75_10710 [Acidobacteriota bacterium]
MKTIFRTSAVLLFAILSASCNKAVVGDIKNDNLSTNDPPFQERIDENQSFVIKNRKGSFTIIPVADYSITSKVVSVKSYSGKWESSLSPVDLALIWGDLVNKKVDSHIKYSQRGRWYYYRYSTGCPVDNSYIISHSSNNHIIPANSNLELALKQVRPGDIVKIEGALVRIKGNTERGNVFWNSSLRRDDTGGGSCEIIYAETIRINKNLYR